MSNAASPSRRVLLPARMIPGMSPGVNDLRRKKISPAILNQHISTWEHSQQAPGQQAATLWQTFSQILLPAPATAGQRLSLATQVAADFLFIAVSFGVAELLFVFLSSAPLPGLVAFSSLTGFPLLYGSLFTLFGYSERLYHPETAREPGRQAVVLAKVMLWSTVLVVMGCASVGMTPLPIVLLLAAVPLNFALMFAYRRVRQRILARGRNRNHQRNVLIVGAGPLGRRLAQALEQGQFGGRVFRGFLDQHQPIATDVLGTVDQLATIARREFIDEVILALPAESGVAREAIWQARRNRIDVKLVPDLLGADPTHVTLEKYGDIPVLTLREEHIPQLGLLLKRITDVGLSAVALGLSAPLLAAVALAIKLESTGPVLYCAPRLGLKGRRFLCYKFRTMVRDADKLKEKLREHNEREGAFFKMANDPRITRVGRVLRRYSLDELPQLWNVFRGEMSLVGPRPHPLDDVQRYHLDDLQRLNVSPGLTGLWQVTARQDPSFERSVALDREYIGRWSLGMDLWILRKTVSAVLRGEGA
ncbi:MAG TPA: sugar transferase [Terriglobales bacterium]|nr:sugar transferase [Terriglobales bacterium]